MTAAELHARYAKGERDFRGVDLRGLSLSKRRREAAGMCLRGADLSGADLRGADLSGADLRDTVLDEIRCGVLWQWQLIMLFLRMSVGSVVGLAGGLLVTFVIYLFVNKEFGPDLHFIPGSLALAVVLGSLLCMVLMGSDSIGNLIPAALFTAIAGTGAGGIYHSSVISQWSVLIFAINISSVSYFYLLIFAVTYGDSACFISVLVSTIVSFYSVRYFAVNFKYDVISVFIGAGAIMFFLKLIQLRTRVGDYRYANVRDHQLQESSRFSTRFAAADLTGASFSNAQLDNADFTNATLDLCHFQRARTIESAFFSPGPLRYVPLLHLLSWGQGQSARSADLDLADLDLQNFVIQDADLRGANLTQTDLRGADLRGSDLLQATHLDGVRVDPNTYARSRWTPEYLQALQGRGVQILSLNHFPEETQDLLLGAREGLTLYFDRGLNVLDHAAVQGIIAHELGPDTDCEVVELKKKDGTEGGHRLYAQNAGHVARAEVVMEGPRALMRLRASHREDLLRIAERLQREASERLQRAAAKRQQEEDQRDFEQSLTVTRQQYEVRLSEQDKEHKLMLAQLVRFYREQTAPHLQSVELHEAIDAPSVPASTASPRLHAGDAPSTAMVPASAVPSAWPAQVPSTTDRRPTKRTVAWYPWRDQVVTDHPPRRLAILSAPEDARDGAELLRHLSGLAQKGLVALFDETRLLAGVDRPAALRELVVEAELVLCLVSAELLAALGPAQGVDGLAQARIHLAEAVKLALARREQDGLVVIPVLLRPASLLDSPFADLKPLPGDGRPISQWSDRDAALVDVVAGVRLHVL